MIIFFVKIIIFQWQKHCKYGKNDGKNLLDKELTENEKRVLLELINNPSIPYDQLVVDRTEPHTHLFICE